MEFECDSNEKDYSLALLKRVQHMQNDRKACDVIIRVENEEIHVHRVIVMASSEYFEAMFTHDTQENQTGIVEIKDIKHGIVEKITNYIYSGKISLHEEECHDLLYAANMFQLAPLCKKIVSFLQSQLSLRSFFTIRRIALKFSSEELNNSCKEFALENLEKLALEEEFNSVELEFIMFLISSKDLDEDTKFVIILQWIKADIEKRKQLLLQLTCLIDFVRVSDSCKSYIVENEEICYKSWEFMRMLFQNARKISAQKPKQPPILSANPHPNSILIFDRTSKFLKVYNPTAESFKEIKRLKTSMTIGNYTATVLKEHLYVLMMGKRCFRMKWKNISPFWEPMENMIYDHGQYLQATGLGQSVYVVGDSKFESLDEMNGNWEKLDVKGTVANESGLLSYLGLIYSIGGSNKGNRVGAYDPSSKSWSSLPPMKYARRTPSAVIFRDKMIVAGGYWSEELSVVELYDFKAKLWTELPQTIAPHDEFKLCVVNHSVFAVGSATDLQCTESYDFEKAEWMSLKGLPNMNIMAAASVSVSLL